MIVVNHDADTNGTHLQGAIVTSYNRLLELFGEPKDDDSYKVSGRWTFTFQGKVFTLYDWKSTALYDDDYPSVKEFRARPEALFNVGGHSDASEFIAELKKLL